MFSFVSFFFRKRLPQLILIFILLMTTILFMRGNFDIALHAIPETDEINRTNGDKDNIPKYQVQRTYISAFRVQQINISKNHVQQTDISESQVHPTSISEKHFQQTNISDYHEVAQNKSKVTEKQHIAFLKVHKAASSTVQNIFYRFGLKRNLSLVLPVGTHYISKMNTKRHYRILPPYDNNTGKYDILCNHAVFNHKKFQKLLHNDSIYVATVREPLQLFISSALYFRYVWPADYLTKIEEANFIHDLINKPKHYEPDNIKESRTFNYMASDFGFEIKSVYSVAKLTENEISSFVSNLTNIFDFVMIVEYFDEGLVIMKRLLNWSMKDILYIKQNEFKQGNRSNTLNTHITEKDKRVFRKRNRLDYAIYETFSALFFKRMSEETGLAEEVSEFKNNLELVRKFCKDTHKNQTVLPATNWNAGITVDRQDCTLMKTDELTFWKNLTDKHKLHLKEIRQS